MPSDFDRDPERARRIRAALYGRGELTREDAELLERQRSSALGWFSRRSTGRSAALALFALLWLGLAVVRITQNGIDSAAGPVILAVALVGALLMGRRRSKLIERALREPPKQ